MIPFHDGKPQPNKFTRLASRIPLDALEFPIRMPKAGAGWLTASRTVAFEHVSPMWDDSLGLSSEIEKSFFKSASACSLQGQQTIFSYSFGPATDTIEINLNDCLAYLEKVTVPFAIPGSTAYPCVGSPTDLSTRWGRIQRYLTAVPVKFFTAVKDTSEGAKPGSMAHIVTDSPAGQVFEVPFDYVVFIASLAYAHKIWQPESQQSSTGRHLILSSSIS